MKRYHVRVVEFIGDQEFTQGHGMTYDSVVIEHEDDETIIDMQAGWTSEGCGFDGLKPKITAFIATPSAPPATTHTTTDKAS